MELKLMENESPYTLMNNEHTMLKQEVANLDNDAMIEECGNLASMFNHTEVLHIIGEYYLNGKISKDSRSTLEGFYILAHTSLLWSDSGEILHFR